MIDLDPEGTVDRSNVLSTVGSGPRLSLRQLIAVVGGLTVYFLAFYALLPSGMQEEAATDYQNTYLPVAERIVDGEGITTPDGEPALRYPPGFSLLIAVAVVVAEAGHLEVDLVVRLLCAATMALTGTILLVLHRERFGSVVGWAGLACWATYPVVLWVSKGPNVELPFMLVLATIALLVSRRLSAGSVSARQAAVLGGLVGACALIRPNGAVMLVPVALALWWSTAPGRAGSAGSTTRSRVWAVGSMSAVALLVVLPWVAWASQESGQVVPLSTNGPEALRQGLEVGGGGPGEVGDTWLPAPVRDLAEDTMREDGLDTTGDIVGFVGDELDERPTRVLALLGVKVVRSWYGTDSLRWDGALAGVQVVYASFMMWGLWAARRCSRGDGYAGFVLVTLLLFWLTCIAGLSIVRILTPALVLLVWLVPLGPMRWWERRRLAQRVGAG